MSLTAPCHIRGNMNGAYEILRQDRLNWAIDRSEEGYSATYIAEALGVTPSVVSMMFKRAGYKPKPPKKTKRLKPILDAMPDALRNMPYPIRRRLYARALEERKTVARVLGDFWNQHNEAGA